MKTEEFINKIESGEAKVLTQIEAEKLVGKEIYWFYFGYTNDEDCVSKLKIGQIVSKKEYYTIIDNSPVDEFSNRFEYWKNKCPKATKKAEDTLTILDKDNKPTFIYCYKNNPYYMEPTFTCSDADREVYFIVLD